jgi:hypothetical protein
MGGESGLKRKNPAEIPDSCRGKKEDKFISGG